jgi:transcriptional regulator with XRE-family HTH domain
MLKTFNPDMLTLARQARGINQSGLADSLKGAINQPRLSRIENGLYAPTDGEVLALARVLGFRAEFFFHPFTRRASPPAYHRKRQKLSKSDWERIYARAEIYRILLAVMLRSVEVESKRSTPPYRDVEDVNGRIEGNCSAP